MPISITIEDNIRYLQQFLPQNKARGMIAELNLRHEIGLVDRLTPNIKQIIS